MYAYLDWEGEQHNKKNFLSFDFYVDSESPVMQEDLTKVRIKEDSEGNKTYFLDMYVYDNHYLECYTIASYTTIAADGSLNDRKAIIREMKQGICITLTKYFYKNLAERVANTDVSLQDIYYLINVFEEDLSSHTDYDSSEKFTFNKEFMSYYIEVQDEFFNMIADDNMSFDDIVNGFKEYSMALSTNNGLVRNCELSWLNDKEKNFLNNLIRATTNEISFVRDFMFAVDKAKLDAKSYGAKGSSNKMWKVLERRSIKSKIRRSMKMDNDATAISTLVLSQNLVDYLKKTENLSLEKTNTCRLLMESYNLMSIVIVDETMEVAKFLFDTGEDDFEVISFNNLERESSDGSYRKVVNLLSKKM
jgi:hypothetical protein